MERYGVKPNYKLDKEALDTHIFLHNPVYQLYRKKTLSYRNMLYHVGLFNYFEILYNKWIAGYKKKDKLNASDTQMFKHFDNITNLEQLYVEAMVGIIWNAGPVRHSVKLESKWFWIAAYTLIETTFSGQTIPQLNFTKYKVCEIRRCYPGYEAKYESFYDTVEKMQRLDWHCVKYPSNSIKLHSQYCQKCNTDKKSDSNRTTCYDPYIEIYLLSNDPIIVVILVFVSCDILFKLVTLYLFTKLRNTLVILASGFKSCMIQIMSQFFLYIALPICLLNKPNQIKCNAQPMLMGTLLTVCLTITATKTFKALHTFNSSLVLSWNEVRRTKIVEWFILVMVCLIQMSICGITFLTECRYCSG